MAARLIKIKYNKTTLSFLMDEKEDGAIVSNCDMSLSMMAVKLKPCTSSKFFSGSETIGFVMEDRTVIYELDFKPGITPEQVVALAQGYFSFEYLETLGDLTDIIYFAKDFTYRFKLIRDRYDQPELIYTKYLKPHTGDDT